MPLKISIEEKVMEESSEVPEDIDTDDDTPPEDAEVLDGEVYYFSKKNGRSTQKFGYEMVE